MSIYTPGQYGSSMVNAVSLAEYRGSGKFDPPPTFDMSINRGNALENSLALYQEVKYEPRDPSITGFHNVSPQENFQVGISGFIEQPVELNCDDTVSFGQRSTNQTPSILLNYFFSKINVEYIQNQIVSEVKRIRNMDISRQSTDELLQIMRYAYMKALSGYLPQTNNPNMAHPRGNTTCSLEEQLRRLNKYVLELTIQQVLSGIDMYLTYYKDASSLPLPLDLPRYTSMAGSRVLSENVGMYSSHNFNRDIQSYNQRYNII